MRSGLLDSADERARPDADVSVVLGCDSRLVMLCLAGRGWISCTRSRKWGLFPVETWHVLAPERKHAMCARLAEVLRSGGIPNARDAVLISLLHAVDAVPQAVPGDPAQLNRRAESLIEAAGIDADQTAQAVREAVRAMLAAIVTSALVAATVSTT